MHDSSEDWITPEHGGLDHEGRLLYGGRPLDLEPKVEGADGLTGWPALATALVRGGFNYLDLQPGDGTSYKLHLGYHNENLYLTLWQGRAHAVVFMQDRWSRLDAARRLGDCGGVWTARLMQVWLDNLATHLDAVLQDDTEARRYNTWRK